MLIIDHDSDFGFLGVVLIIALLVFIVVTVLGNCIDNSMQECIVCHKKERKQNMHMLGEPRPEYLCHTCFMNILINGASK